MFTGLIQHIGQVASIEQNAAGATLTITIPTAMASLLKLGASVAIDGVCTTVTRFDESSFTLYASPETLSRTIMGHYSQGSEVNLELPLQAGGELGGHFVTGHVDGLATVSQVYKDGDSWRFDFSYSEPVWGSLLIEKGSVAINGISLTVNTVSHNGFSVAIIPHTMEATTLGVYTQGSQVNVEFDMLGKYVVRFLQQSQKSAAC